MTVKQFLMCKLNEKFIGDDDPDFSDEFILEILSEIEISDLLEIMEDYADYKLYSENNEQI